MRLSCFVSPSSLPEMRRSFGSTSVSIHGPIGQNVSKPLARPHCGSARCRSRIVASSAMAMTYMSRPSSLLPIDHIVAFDQQHLIDHIDHDAGVIGQDANAIAGLVGGAITIEDQRGRVLAYSAIEGQTIDEPRQQSILGRQVPDTPSVRALYKQLWSSDSVIRVETIADLESLPRIAAPITVGFPPPE